MGGDTSNFRRDQLTEKFKGDVESFQKSDVDESDCEAHHHSGGRLEERMYSTKVTDLDMDSLVICASNLALRDLTNMAMTCRSFRDAAYADSVWEIQCRLANSFAVGFVPYGLREL